MTGLITTLVLIFLDLPLFVILAGLTIALFWVNPHPGSEEFLTSWVDFSNNFNMLERAVGLAQQPTLIAIPFFTLAGTLMSRGSIADRLIKLADTMFGWLPGGLAISTVAACALFAAISGSSPVTVITIGTVMYPALLARKYPDQFSLGLVTSAGSLGIIIPPSIPMIVYAIFATQAGAPVKVEELFIAGFLPGLLIAGALVAYCLVAGWKFEREKFDIPAMIKALREAAWSLVVPFVILGGIYLGVFDTTAAAAIAVILALLIELFIHRSLEFDDLPSVMTECGVLMGAVLVIIGVALGMSEYLTIHQIPDQIVAWLRSNELSPITFIILLDVILLVIGCLMDIISAIILFVPLFVPIALALGFDPIHIGLIFIVNLEIGYLTPPIGLNLFVAAGLFNKTFGYALRSAAPFVVVIFICLGIVTMVPAIPLVLVNATRPESKRVSMAFPMEAPPLSKKKEGETDEPEVDVLKLAGAKPAKEGDAAAGEPKMKSVAQVMAESRESGIVGDVVMDEDFEPVGTLMQRMKGPDGKDRVVVLIADLDLCVDPEDNAALLPDDDTLVLRIWLPADVKTGQHKVPSAAQLDFGVMTEGKFKVNGKATAGQVIISDLPGAKQGAFGVFSVTLGGKKLSGKFKPDVCEDGKPAFGGLPFGTTPTAAK
ncbi:MAG: TRAP transporter large permease subunit [Myxococcales bacterium]|nr:TRAP transporter large permease subunit [Myxococcales bacterium]